MTSKKERFPYGTKSSCTTSAELRGRVRNVRLESHHTQRDPAGRLAPRPDRA